MFDVLTAAAVADELAATVLDGRIQRIGLVDRRTLAAEVYAGGRRHALVASADDRRPRLHLAPALPSLDAELVTPFGLLLRKYARGGRLVGVDQPPLERLVRLSIAKRLPAGHEKRAGRDGRDGGDGVDGEVGLDGGGGLEGEAEDDDGEGEWEATYVHLYVEVMGRHSNLILVDDEGRIMDAAKRVSAAMSRVRPIAPKRPYVSPPPVAKPDPRRLTAPAAAAFLSALPPEAELWRALVAGFRGLSPQLAREVAFRVGGSAGTRVGGLSGAEAAAVLARETRALLEPLLTSAWAPRLYRRPVPPAPASEPPAAESGEPVAYAAIPLAHLASEWDEQPVASISLAVALVDGDGEATGERRRHAQRRERLLAAIAGARAKAERRLAAVRAEGARAAEAERLRRWGETIYANLWQIRPGETALEVDGERIELLPGLDAKATAQTYFERYRKARSAGAHQAELETEIATELAYLDQLAVLVAQAAGFAELEALAAEWEHHAGPPADAARRKPPPPGRPRPLLDAEGNAVFVGRTATQNDVVTFDLIGPDDTWLHARGVPGSHVVIRWRTPREEERAETVAAAAALAGWYSGAREAARVEVDITKRRHVRKIKGARPGLVTYRNERTISVRPADERALAGVLEPTGDR